MPNLENLSLKSKIRCAAEPTIDVKLITPNNETVHIDTFDHGDQTAYVYTGDSDSRLMSYSQIKNSDYQFTQME